MLKSIKRITETKNDITGYSPVLSRVYANRNVKSENELDYSINKLHPFDQLKGISEGVSLISDAIKNIVSSVFLVYSM